METYMIRFTIILVKGIGYLVLLLCDIIYFSQREVPKKLPFYKIFSYLICN